MDENLLFTKEDWDAAMPGVVRAMTEYLRPYRTPIYRDRDTFGEGWGSGSYLRLGDRIFILTNEHVAVVREQGVILTNQFDGQEDIRRIIGNHIAFTAPLDLALLPVDMAAWSDQTNRSKAIEIEQISLAHDPVEGELLTFAGFAGEGVTFHFNTLFAQSTCYTAREIVLPADVQFSSRFHFGLDYRPDRATTVIGHTGLPLPPGLSGSTVWNTNFVAAKMDGIEWTPELARVTGVVWGWPSGDACLVATKAEYLRSFLLGATSRLEGRMNNSIVASQDEYKERYAAFLDLLGFKALVYAAEGDKKEHSRLQDVLELLNQTLCNVPRCGFRFTHFSDCIIITADVLPEALETVFSSVETLTRNLLQYDVLVRGGITRGGAFHSQRYVYGTAVSRSAVIEKEEAQAPLVLLAPEVYQDVVALGPRLLPWIEADGPDRHFVHYLVQYAIYHQQPRLPGTVILDVDAERIAFYISRRLLNHTGRVRDKAEWFQAYWNRTVARPGGGFPPIEANPALTEPVGPRTTIIKRLVASKD